MEYIGYNPESGEAILQESHPGEHQERVSAWRESRAGCEYVHGERYKTPPPPMVPFGGAQPPAF